MWKFSINFFFVFILLLFIWCCCLWSTFFFFLLSEDIMVISTLCWGYCAFICFMFSATFSAPLGSVVFLPIGSMTAMVTMLLARVVMMLKVWFSQWYLVAYSRMLFRIGCSRNENSIVILKGLLYDLHYITEICLVYDNCFKARTHVCI